MNIEREIEIVNTFIIPRKRERYREFVNSPKGRAKLLEGLYHFADFDPTCLIQPPHSEDDLIAELRRLGAGEDCYVVSVAKELDGLTNPLEDVIRGRVAPLEGSIVCCVRGELAYYEGEAPHNRFILHRPRSNKRFQPTAASGMLPTRPKRRR